MDQKEKKAFRLVDRFHSFKHAFRGIQVLVSNTHNAWVELVATACVIILGFYFSIGSAEWLALIISTGMLLMAEGFNTAMEVHMNLTSPGQHLAARDTKDMAAGAVLIATIVAIAVTLIIFLPKIFS